MAVLVDRRWLRDELGGDRNSELRQHRGSLPLPRESVHVAAVGHQEVSDARREQASSQEKITDRWN